MVLSEIKKGTRVVVKGIELESRALSRLASLGLVVGSKVEVLDNRGKGPMLMRVYSTRVAVSRKEAALIAVKKS